MVGNIKENGIRNGDHLKVAKDSHLPSESRHKFTGAWLPFESISRLEQPRRTFEEIPSLADSIAVHGVANPITVAQLSEEACARYLDVINKVWGTVHASADLETLTLEREKKFHILIAGERRYRAIGLLKEQGCEDCQAEEIAETCYENHFGRSEVEVRLMVNVSARDALDLQSAENIHKRVPPHEDARFLYEYYRFVKEDEPEYTLRGFARGVSRGEEQIRDAIRFCELPENVQDSVKLGQISYGIAIQISRLHRHSNPNVAVSKEELDWWVIKAITGQYKVPDFKELITGYIKEREGGQKSMFEIMTESQRNEFEHAQRELVVEKGILRALHAQIAYLQRVQDLYKTGKLGEKDSPYSQGSPGRLVLKLAEVMSQIIPDLKEHKALSRKNLAFVDEVVSDTMKLVEKAEADTGIVLSEGKQEAINSGQTGFSL